MKDNLHHCQCIVSGGAIEIESYLSPLKSFGSYENASHRIFMSATITDDAFLIKGLRLKRETILKPLTYLKEGWSGEKMVLFPSLIHDELNRDKVIEFCATSNTKRDYGVVALVPAEDRTKTWKNYGAVVATKESGLQDVLNLRNSKYENTIVLVNRYDGIDLPDSTCRILILDNKPYSENLIDLYDEKCRPGLITLLRTVRTIEQGMGRSVRGEKDFSVIIIIGNDIIRLIRDKKSRKIFSSQMIQQIEIGSEITKMLKDDIAKGKKPKDVLNNVVNQCLLRDEGWKEFYVERMSNVTYSEANQDILLIYETELKAEEAYYNKEYNTAITILQEFINNNKEMDKHDKGWYLQEMARYKYCGNEKIESHQLQTVAHKTNHFLLKLENATPDKLTLISQGRIEGIIQWIKQFEDYTLLSITLSDILGSLVFGAKAKNFESSLNEIGKALGFKAEQPDKEWKEGPDNLWVLNDKKYILWECKNEVDLRRSEIIKKETEQMNQSSDWFKKNYSNIDIKDIKRIIIHPTKKVEKAAFFRDEVEVMREAELKKFVKQLNNFFVSFESQDLQNLSAPYINKLLSSNELTIESLWDNFTTKPIYV